MSHGAPVKADSIPVGRIVVIYAAIGNLKDAVTEAERIVDKLGKDDSSPSLWADLKVTTERIKSRSITLVSAIRSLAKSQEEV